MVKTKLNDIITKFRQHKTMPKSDVLQLEQCVDNQKVKQLLRQHFLTTTHKNSSEIMKAVQLLLQQRYITSAQLSLVANDPRRVPRTIKDFGYPIYSAYINRVGGKKTRMAIYFVGSIQDFNIHKCNGRNNFSRTDRKHLYKQQLQYQRKHNHQPHQKYVHCAFCGATIPTPFRGEVDHRYPFKFIKQIDDTEVPVDFDHYQFVCSSCNRNKAEACDSHSAWIDQATKQQLRHEYYVHPEDYTTCFGVPMTMATHKYTGKSAQLYLKQQKQIKALVTGKHISVQQVQQKLLKHVNQYLNQLIKDRA